MFEIYKSCLGPKMFPEPCVYVPSDVLYRNIFNAPAAEPDLETVFPVLRRTGDGYDIDPYAIYIGQTVGGKPFAYNPRHVVNPLILILGTPGSGKSVPPGEPVLVVRDHSARLLPIERVEYGDRVIGVWTSNTTVSLAQVYNVVKHRFDGTIYRFTTLSGRSVRVTGDHSLIVYRDGRLDSVPASLLGKWDVLVLPFSFISFPAHSLDGSVLPLFQTGIVLSRAVLGRVSVEDGRVIIEDEDGFVEEQLEYGRVSFARSNGRIILDDKISPSLIRMFTGQIPDFVFTFDARLRSGLLTGLLSGNYCPCPDRRTAERLLLLGQTLGVPLRMFEDGRVGFYTAPVRMGDVYSGVILDPIVEIEEEEYSGPVYDLSTSTQNFMLGSGILAHNSATLKTIVLNTILGSEMYGYDPFPIIVVDPEGEYAVLREFFDKSESVHFRLGERDYINIFERPSKAISPLAWYARMEEVIAKFLDIGPGQTPSAYGIFKKEIWKAADRAGITLDPRTWNREDITLEQVYSGLTEMIEKIKKGEAKEIEESEKKQYLQGGETLKQRLERWTHPPADIFFHKSSVNLTDILKYKLVIFDGSQLPRYLYGLFTYWLVDWLYGFLLVLGPLPTFGIRFMLAIDEAWSLLKKEKKEGFASSNPLEDAARRIRKYGGLLIVATQTVEDVDEKMFSLFGTLVAGIIPSEQMAKKIVESRGMPKRFLQTIKTLGRGTLVWSINWSRRDKLYSTVPIVVRTSYLIPDLIKL